MTVFKTPGRKSKLFGRKIQIWQKEIQIRWQENQIQRLIFLGFPSPNRAFSKSYADPQGHFFFSSRFRPQTPEEEWALRARPGSLSVVRSSFPVPLAFLK
jgi:hypothetical protein